MNVGDVVLWNRRQRGGRRRVTPIMVVVCGFTPAGYVTVGYSRRQQPTYRTVHPAALEAVT